MIPFFTCRYPLPEAVRTLLQTLEQAGFEAYAVGGCVRDTLLGRTPHDWDITTAATPDEVERVFAASPFKVVGTVGRAFGVSLVECAGATYEVATFRGEEYGADSHRPEKVYYAKHLADDLARRDFTVNAMAFRSDGILIDPYDGRKDLRKKRLQTVGAPDERFREDALRLFRACRFIAQLGFRPTRELCAAMPPAFARVEGLSLERVRAELDRLLVAPYAGRGLDLFVRSGLAEQTCRVREQGIDQTVAILPELSHLPETPQGRFHAYDAWLHTLVVVEHSPATLVARYAALFHDAAKGLPGIRGFHKGDITDYGHDVRSAEMAKAALTRLQYPATMVSRVEFLVANHMKYHQYANTAGANVRRWLRQLARSGNFRTTVELTEALDELNDLCVADVIGCGRPLSATDGHRAFGGAVRAELATMPVHTRDLRYDPSLQQRYGKDTATVLKVLRQRVQDGTLANEPEALTLAAERYQLRQERNAHDEGTSKE